MLDLGERVSAVVLVMVKEVEGLVIVNIQGGKGERVPAAVLVMVKEVKGLVIVNIQGGFH